MYSKRFLLTMYIVYRLVLCLLVLASPAQGRTAQGEVKHNAFGSETLEKSVFLEKEEEEEEYHTQNHARKMKQFVQKPSTQVLCDTYQLDCEFVAPARALQSLQNMMLTYISAPSPDIFQILQYDNYEQTSPFVAPEVCEDQDPPGNFDCSFYQQTGLCKDAVAQQFCARSCTDCLQQQQELQCDDIPIPGTADCSQVIENDLCTNAQVIANQNCRRTCGLCELQKIEEQKSALQYLQESRESIETGTFADLALSPNLDVNVQNEIADVDFGGILCIPSNDAFNQFFDDTGINTEDLKSDAEALTQVIGQNIIPGPVNLPAQVGDNITTDSLLQGASMVITRLPDEGLQVYAAGMEGPATKTRHIDIGRKDLAGWELDKVLIPPAFTVLISVSNKDVLQFIQGQPGLTNFQQILKSPNLSLGIHAFIAGNSPGRLFAPTDKVFEQFFQKYAVTLDDFLKFSESTEVIGSLLVYDLSLNEKDVFENKVWNFGKIVDPKVSLKADLNEQTSVWVVNRLYVVEI